MGLTSAGECEESPYYPTCEKSHINKIGGELPLYKARGYSLYCQLVLEWNPLGLMVRTLSPIFGRGPGPFHEFNIWACVSDQDGKGLDVKAILADIIESSTNEKPSNVSTMQSIQQKFQEELKDKVYLLILDDVWTEDPNEWGKLRRYLTIGARGSRVVITTRSEKTAEMVLGRASHSKEYMLKGLSEENSWRLFVLTAFERDSNEANDIKLRTIGAKIVEKCSNVPLAIKVLGTLLYGQTHRWESFERNRLPHIETSKNPIMSILKLSYNNLEPSMKNCFRYCALFPKDVAMNKRELISLWMAQGYIGDSEDCFLVLLKRCFFQDVERNVLGDVESFTMHDLMHDLAQEVAGDEIIMVNGPPNNLSKKVRHLLFDGEKCTKSSFHETNIRTCYMDGVVHSDVVKSLVANWRSLRSLHLCMHGAENLPESIGDLLHLRHLDLTDNRSLKTLPISISKLYNLQSLILQGCFSLQGWPKEFCKLVNLRLLDIRDCSRLIGMPLGIGQLTNLLDLTVFKVGKGNSIGKPFGGQLNDLNSLVNLRGELEIKFHENPSSDSENKWEGSYLESIKNLKVLRIDISYIRGETIYEALIEKLQPNQNLLQLCLYGYNGTEIPRWGRTVDDWAINLPNLVNVELRGCERLDGIPLLSNLKHLKSLSLQNLNNLEYMEISYGLEDLPFFPSLEFLSFFALERLKGWWGGVVEGDRGSGMSPWHPKCFPRLSQVVIQLCPELTSLPPCPSLESLEVMCSNKALRILPGEGPANLDHKLWVKEIDSVGYLTTLPAFRLTQVVIRYDDELESLSEIEEVFKGSSSLRSLEIESCEKLTSISGALEHLTALESLSLINLPTLVDDPVDMPWRSLCHNLRSLKLKSLRTWKNLPTGLKHLTALQELTIENCSLLEGLPEWISCLSSLHSLTLDNCPQLNSLGMIQTINSLHLLDIRYCPELKEACKEPNGKEWPNIRHIPYVFIDNFGE